MFELRYIINKYFAYFYTITKVPEETRETFLKRIRNVVWATFTFCLCYYIHYYYYMMGTTCSSHKEKKDDSTKPSEEHVDRDE